MTEADYHRQTQTGKKQAKHKPTRYRQTQKGIDKERYKHRHNKDTGRTRHSQTEAETYQTDTFEDRHEQSVRQANLNYLTDKLTDSFRRKESRTNR